MITKEAIQKWLEDPTSISATKEELKELITHYPYCGSVYWIYLRYLYQNDDIIFEQELLRYGMYISDRRQFYEYLTFQEHNSPELSESPVISAPTDYFAIAQDPAKQQTLQQLAVQLKQARMAKTAGQKTEKQNDITPNINIYTIDQTADLQEKKAIMLIKEKKYSSALEILKAINLNNPKKSAYFALQIRYLETIINNNK